MSERTNTVAVSRREKRRLDSVSRSLFGTKRVPYGIVVDRLADNFEQGQSAQQ